ncbi:probable protein phosphatase 2C 47 [Fagus crenata]
MAPGTEFSLQTNGIDSVSLKGTGVSAMEDQNNNNNNDNTLEGLAPVNTRKPPRSLTVMRHCTSSAWLAESESDIGFLGLKSPSDETSGFLPIFRSGRCSEKGPKQYMEDEHIRVDNLHEHLGTAAKFSSPCAFYGVFDGHGGIDAASFIRKNILNYIVEDSHFPSGIKKAVRSAFVKADHALADAATLDSSSGTTALTALIMGRTMLIANAGDSRAVLGKRGRAIELSKDHKPNCTAERLRIEKLGGVIYDGYLNGQLSVARALGDWHIKGSKGSICPLSSEPEFEEIILSEEDEFLIMGCDGLWDVMSSQCAVTMVRKELMMHNDPDRCSSALVKEALQRNTCDNLTVVVVCFSPDPPPKIEIPKSHKRRSISAEGLDLLKGVLNGL